MLFSHRHVHKFCQRNQFFSEVPKVDLTRFGNKLFNCRWNHAIYEIRCKKKKVAVFVNRPIAPQFMALKYQHKTAWTQEAPCRPIEETRHFFFPSTLFNKTDVLIMKITLNCKEWPFKLCVKILFMLIFEWINELKYFLIYIKKCQTGTYFFGWVYIKKFIVRKLFILLPITTKVSFESRFICIIWWWPYFKDIV